MDEIEKSNLLSQIREQQVELNDYKERYKERKSKCLELEGLVLQRQEKAQYFETQLKAHTNVLTLSGRASQE